MKNNCDVSMSYVACLDNYSDCEFFSSTTGSTNFCAFNKGIGRCTCTAAIRAAIEAEGMKMNCPDCGAEKTLLCDCWKASDHIADANKKGGE